MKSTLKKAKRQLARLHVTLDEIKVNLDVIDERKAGLKGAFIALTRKIEMNICGG